MNTFKVQINTIYDETLKGSVIRSKAEQFQNGEKHETFVCNREKYNYMTRTITNLNIEHGNVIDKHPDILK